MMINNVKLVVAALLLIAGIAGYYLLADQILVLRVLAVIAGFVAAIGVLWTTPIGQQSLGFIGESVAEAKKSCLADQARNSADYFGGIRLGCRDGNLFGRC